MAIFASIAIFVSAGCTIFEKERTNRGGYLDYLVDKYWMKADSKGMRALRAFAIQVSLARIASVSEKNDIDRQLLAIRIGALTKRFLPVYACAFNRNPLRVPGTENDPCFYYDSAMVDYANGLFDLAMVALPVEDAKRLLGAATGSAVNPLNLVDVLDSLLSIGRDAIKYGRIVGALYRDTVELEVQLWLTTPPIDDRPPPFLVTEADVALLRGIYAGRNDDLQSWLAAIAELRGRGLEPLAQPRFFVQLGGLMKYICTLITQEPKALERCQADLPSTLPPAIPVLSNQTIGSLFRPSGGGFVGGGGSGGGGGSSGGGGGVSQTSTGGSTQTKLIQANLCVTQTGQFDDVTREAMRQAMLGAKQSQLAGGQAPSFDEADFTSKTNLQIFASARNCSKDKSNAERAYATAFEKFRFVDRAAIGDLRRSLNACDPNVTAQPSDVFDLAMRTAITNVKAQATAEEKAGFGNYPAGALNDKSYDYINGKCKQPTPR